MKSVKGVIGLIVFVILAAMVFSVPYGPSSSTKIRSERANFSDDPKQVGAQAGNVTELSIDANVITKRWQGYYGNVSGSITLDDAQNNTMFSWGGSISPVGEIYAANYTVSDWNDVVCVNLAGNGTLGDSGINVTILENMYNMSYNAGDGIDETFEGTNDIGIGTNSLSGCPATNTYVNGTNQTTSNFFNETLLTENQTGTVIYATQIDQDSWGFDGAIWDFQLIVGENGDVDGTTTYYFYVELT